MRKRKFPFLTWYALNRKKSTGIYFPQFTPEISFYTGSFFLHRKFLFTVVIHDAPVKSMLSAEKKCSCLIHKQEHPMFLCRQ
jgi:hypothetical protein